MLHKYAVSGFACCQGKYLRNGVYAFLTCLHSFSAQCYSVLNPKEYGK